MPWIENTRFKLRMQFIHDYESELYAATELCELYGVSRSVGYKWVRRYGQEGFEGLRDRSRAPLSCPHRTPEDIVEALLEARRKHPAWGPKKLIPYLARRRPELEYPAPSTMGAIFKRNGLVEGKRKRRKITHPGKPLTQALCPNQLWAADYKGQFKTLDGNYCFPLTVTDQYSRFLLGCEGLNSTKESEARPVFKRLFREYGLPEAIRTDNGTPFATTAIGRLSRLSVWWIKLGIRPELTQPAHPQQNGRHERMHKTLKAATTQPPGQDLSAQQIKLDEFMAEFNNDRPHEALGQVSPDRLYEPAPRPYPSKIPAVEYPAHFEVRRVSRNGGIRWKTGWVNISHALIEERVGLEETDDGLWSMYFGPLLLGRFDERDKILYGVRNQ